MAVYAAAKAFVPDFTEALWQESRGTGLRVLALSPGATDTEFVDVIGADDADGGAGRQSPREVVETALRTLDRRPSTPSVVSGRLDRVMVGLGRGLSRRRAVLLMGPRPPPTRVETGRPQGRRVGQPWRSANHNSMRTSGSSRSVSSNVAQRAMR